MTSVLLGNGVTIQHDQILDKATTSSFVTALDVSTSSIRDSTFIIHNKTGGDLDYQILGNLGVYANIVDPTGTNDDDKGWVVLKSSTSVATGTAPAVETLSNPYSRVIVQIKHTSLTTNVNIWHKGQS